MSWQNNGRCLILSLYENKLSSVIWFDFGYNSTEKLQEKALEAIAENATDNNVDIDLSVDTVNLKDEKTGASASFGENVKLPSDFPQDVPIFPDATVMSVGTTSEGVAATLKIEAQAVKVTEWYDDRLINLGWKKEAGYAAGGSEMRSFTKDGATLALNLVGSGKEEFAVTIMKNNEK